MRSASIAAAALASTLSCSSSSVNEGSGGASTGGGGGSGGQSGGGPPFDCVTSCRNGDSDGYAAFIKTLKNFACGNTTCSKLCSNMCDAGEINAACAGCLIDKPLSDSVLLEVKQDCTQYSEPQCASFASCVESCMQ